MRSSKRQCIGFLPILGFWMVPVGLTVLAIDIQAVRKFTKKVSATTGRWWKAVKRRWKKFRA